MRSYAVTAEFYDLLHASEYLRRVQALLDRWLGEPQVGALDVGAGTGLATGLLAQRCRTPVHAVEPTASMRSVLLSRLAGRPELLARVRLHAAPVQRLGLSRVADFALCLNTMSGLDETERGAALAAIARATVRGGLLVIQRPPDRAAAERYDLPSWYLGGDIYSGEVACTPVATDLVDYRFTYRVTRDDILVRQETETFPGHVTSAAAFAAELTAHGFVPVDSDTPDVVVARRIG